MIQRRRGSSGNLYGVDMATTPVILRASPSGQARNLLAMTRDRMPPIERPSRNIRSVQVRSRL
ncbi:MAG: hypothetical protein COZ54_01360 [Anaerolineae bacterium CG_4_8_14_3_um_filter_59_70]|nr:MAG: hypothetical protein COZ54_01360 [Anaerolineae bacterium CG_4_8_14_3_um_filter_59_70]